jgi:hypothetical protein
VSARHDARASPVTASTAARLARGCPPAVVNSPPRKTVDPSSETATARTTPFVPGLNVRSTVPSGRAAATLARAMPPNLVNVPPRMTRSPALASA